MVRMQWMPEQLSIRLSSKGKAKMQQRWTSKDIAPLHQDLIGDASIFGYTEENLKDIRGIHLDIGGRNIEIKDSDLSFGVLKGKFSIKNSVLKYIHYEGELHTLSHCTLIGSVLHMQIHTNSLKDFSFSNNDCSYCHVKEISRSVRLDNGPFVEKCIFDYSKITSISLVHFKECSFKNTNFNKASIVRSVFENCTFAGASFDSTFYSSATFIHCEGLDKEKMLEYHLHLYGMATSDIDNITII